MRPPIRAVAAVCLLLPLLLSSVTSARASLLAKTGWWEAHHTVADDGGQICSIVQFNNGMGLLIKMDQLRNFFIHLTKDHWNVPREARMGVSFLVDGRQIVKLPFSGTTDASMIEGNLAPEEAAALIDRFALGRHMEIRFLTGNEGYWAVPLQGTYRITQTFLRCISAMTNARQPFDAAVKEQSQPF
jgi:hypothetical protein